MNQPRLSNGRFASSKSVPPPTVATAKKPRKKKATNVAGFKNYVAIIIDKSGSMAGIASPARDSVNSILKQVQESSKFSGIETKVSLTKFAYNPEVLFENTDPDKVTFLDHRNYNPDGQTALYDTVISTIDYLKNRPDANDHNVAFLVYVITDGQENYSKAGSHQFAKAIRDVQATDRWTFGFQLPPYQSRSFINQSGVPAGNVREWEATSLGIAETAQVTNVSTQSFYEDRSRGLTKSVSLFTTDLSNVSVKDVTGKCDDLSNKFKAYEVKSEASVKAFVEEKTKKEYVIGQAYYTLMKPEKVQLNKEILIQEKGKKAVWGGTQARKVLGLPADKDVKVIPGNHSNFDIFVQSTSVNRILPRGTKTLIDLTQTKNLTPTWDHVAAEAAKQAKIAAGT